MELKNKITRSDIERSWDQFVIRLGYSNLTDALRRKSASFDDMMSLEATQKLFSIEIGLSQILKRWKITRKLAFPNTKEMSDAYFFATSCVEIWEQLNAVKAPIFRSRVLSELLPSGRACFLDHEFRIAKTLCEFGWHITHAGFCGEPGVDLLQVEKIGRSKLKENACRPMLD
jgi:hypothetical protein